MRLERQELVLRLALNNGSSRESGRFRPAKGMEKAVEIFAIPGSKIETWDIRI
jgi:hypothetical protein